MTDQKKPEENVVHLTIDGKEVTAPKGTTVYSLAKSLGIEIPIFCYHDRMPPFGACRVCLVEVEKMPRLQTACTLEVAEGMVVKTQSALAVEGRKEILELLLINHPLDCPICDRGGECPLQEHAFDHGPEESRFFEEKRHFKKPLSLGPVLMLDRERCIACARCTRFGEIVASDHALELLDRGYKTEVGTQNQKPVESKFIGNTIMICPVGALTSQVYRFRARPWDNDPTNSTCTLCPVGCSLIIDSRDGQIMRTRSRETKEVNDIWLCDKGWFGYEFTYNPDRLKTPLVRRNGTLEPASWDDALNLVAEKIKQSKRSGKLAGLGGNPLTIEENYLFQQLMREVIGVQHLDHRIGMPLISLEDEGIPPGMEISIGECETLSFVFLLGIDLTEEFPVIWLRLKQAINNGATAAFIGHYAPEISSDLKKTILHKPGEEQKMIHEIQQQLSFLDPNKKAAIFIGRQYLASPQRLSILSELSKISAAHPNLSLNVMEGSGNSLGARFAGMRPDLGPMNEKLQNPGLNSIQIVEEAAKSEWNFLIVAGANPAMKFPSSLWNQARSKLDFLVVQDLFLTETAQQADVVLPVLSFVEKGGSFLNIEQRVQTLLPGKEVPENIYNDGDIFCQLAKKLNGSLAIDAHFSHLLQQNRLSFKRPAVKASSFSAESNDKAILKATFAPALFDHEVRMKHNPHLVWLAKEPYVRLHPSDGKQRAIQDGDLIHLKHNGNSIQAKTKLDARIAQGTVVIPLGFKEIPVNELGTNLMNGLTVEIEK